MVDKHANSVDFVVLDGNSDAKFAAINISHHSFHGDWNYKISPNA
jgi:hypothetical protein